MLADANHPPTDETPLLDGIATTQHESQSLGSQTGLTPGLSQKLYVSHFLSTCNARIFEFGAVLFLSEIFPATLLPTSVYALVRAASAILLSPAVGHLVDTRNRLQVVRLSIVGQRIAVALSCAIFWQLCSHQSIPFRPWLLGCLAFLACVEKLCFVMNTVAIERDWVVVIAGSEDSTLQVLNSQMRRIDLFCKLAGPLAIALINGISTKVGILVTLVMNITSVAVEYFAILKVYDAFPMLHLSRDPAIPAAQLPGAPTARLRTLTSWYRSISTLLSFYFRHPVFLPSMALSLLYFTVLSFAGQMVTYLLSVGYNSSQVGVVRTLSVVFEMLATWIAPLVSSMVGPFRGGLWFINWQQIWVLVAVILFLHVPFPVFAATGLVGGVILSRIGLWGFDLCLQMIVQREVEPQNRGMFSTTEVSFHHIFELCSHASTVVFSRPNQFKYPVIMSGVAVWLAGIMYARFVRERRGHLLHKPSCLKRRGD